MFLSKYILIKNCYTDSIIPNQIGFQDPATPIFAGIIDLHNEVFFYLIIVLTTVTWVIIRILWLFSGKTSKLSSNWFYWTPKLYNEEQPRLLLKPKKYTHNTTLEIVWTITPAIILMLIAIPSFALLYSMYELIDPAMTIKAIGHQWYWTYEYSDYNIYDKESLIIDSYMLPEDSLREGQLRLLDVDNRIKVPVNTHIRLISTSTDVIHSWTVPSFGVKIDAIPGRLNQVSLFIQREGVYYGQCSEICGVNHGFMPIVVEAVSLDEYVNWINNHLNK
jgi:cytochrome c oxidase subunit 2